MLFFLKKDLFNVRFLGVFLIVPVLYIESAKLTVYYKAIQFKKNRISDTRKYKWFFDINKHLIKKWLSDIRKPFFKSRIKVEFMISKKDFFLTEYDASFLIFSKECDSESNSPVYSVHDLLNAPPPKKIKIEIVYTTAYLYIVSRET